MNHDITHCNGIDCPIKKECFRYQAHLEVKEKKYEYPVIYFIDGALCFKAKAAIKENEELS